MSHIQNGPKQRHFYLTVLPDARNKWHWWQMNKIWVQSFYGMIIARGNQGTQRKTCLSVSYSNTNSSWTRPESNQDPLSDRPATTTQPQRSLIWNMKFCITTAFQFSLFNIPLARYKKTMIGCKWMEHIGFCFMTKMFIYWAQLHNYYRQKHRNSLNLY